MIVMVCLWESLVAGTSGLEPFGGVECFPLKSGATIPFGSMRPRSNPGRFPSWCWKFSLSLWALDATLPSQKGQLGGKTDAQQLHIKWNQVTSRIVQEKRDFWWQLEKAFILPVDFFCDGLFWAQDIQPKEFFEEMTHGRGRHSSHITFSYSWGGCWLLVGQTRLKLGHRRLQLDRLQEIWVPSTFLSYWSTRYGAWLQDLAICGKMWP